MSSSAENLIRLEILHILAAGNLQATSLRVSRQFVVKKRDFFVECPGDFSWVPNAMDGPSGD